MQSVAYVSELPVIESQGGVIVFTYASGAERRSHALPMWLARMVWKRVGDLIAEQDQERTAA